MAVYDWNGVMLPLGLKHIRPIFKIMWLNFNSGIMHAINTILFILHAFASADV